MNIYVSQMKDILKSYYNKQKKYNEQIEENNRRFSEEYAKKENESVKQQQTQEYEHTQEIINDIYRTAREYLAIASFPNVEQLTADRHIFESGMDLSVETVRAFVERYSNPYNPTMLSYIQGWINKNNKTDSKQMFGKYDSIKIITPKEQLSVYKKFGEGALRIANSIYNNGNIMIKPLELDSYADERFSANLFNVIGDGMSLSDYKTARVPSTAKNSFDNINLNDGQNAIA